MMEKTRISIKQKAIGCVRRALDGNIKQQSGLKNKNFNQSRKLTMKAKKKSLTSFAYCAREIKTCVRLRFLKSFDACLRGAGEKQIFMNLTLQSKCLIRYIRITRSNDFYSCQVMIPSLRHRIFCEALLHVARPVQEVQKGTSNFVEKPETVF